jgi:hypothetical protein
MEAGAVGGHWSGGDTCLSAYQLVDVGGLESSTERRKGTVVREAGDSRAVTGVGAARSL